MPLKNLINFWRNFRVTFLNRSRHKSYFLPKVKLDNYNIMIYEKNIFDQLIKDDNMKMLQTLLLVKDMIAQLFASLTILVSKKEKKEEIIAIDIRKQKARIANPKAIQQINF